MAHCNPQMTDFAQQPAIGLNGGVYVKSRDTLNAGVSTGDGCSSNGTVVACSYRQPWNAIVVYDGDGNILWGSGNLLDDRTFTTVPVIQADGSMIAGDDQHIYKFNPDGSVAWAHQSPGGAPIGLVPTPNGAIVSATGIPQVTACWESNCSLAFNIQNGGSGYTSASVLLVGGNCPGASATATVQGGAVTAVSATSQGPDCDIAPDVIIVGNGANASVSAVLVPAGPVNLYSAANGAVLGSMYLYQTGNAGPYYVANNTPCLNNTDYPNRVYVLTNLSTDLSEGALWALDIDPNNPSNPMTPAWSVVIHGPSAASPLCVGDHIYFDGRGIVPGDNAGTTIFGVQDNGTSGSFLFQVPLGPGTNQLTCNFAQDPRPEGGFWHQIKNDPSIYHRDYLTGELIESVNVTNLLTAAGAPSATYWQAGAFATYGTPDQPYMLLPEAAIPTKPGYLGYLAMLDLNTLQLSWALPLAGNDPDDFDDPGGDATIVLDSSQNPVLVMSGKNAGAFFIAAGGPDATVSSNHISFGPQATGSTSSALSVTLFSSASSTLTINSISVSGPFSHTSTCGATLLSGLSCSVSVQFSPTSGGTAAGTLTISSNSQGGPLTVALDGIGAASTPVVLLSANQLSFPTQADGTISPAQPVTLQNGGSAPLAISQIAVSGAAAQSNNCPTILAAGASCTINVMLAAPSSGSCSGSVKVNSNAPGGPATVSLNGACQPAGSVESALSTSSLVFAPASAGTVTPAQTVTLTNIGTLSLNIASITASANAIQTNNCGTVLAVGGKCAINISFAPTAIGPLTASVSVNDAAPDSPHIIAISAAGLANPVPIVNQPLLPSAVLPGTQGATLLVNGSGFVPGSVVYWNGSPRVTQSVGASQLSAALTVSDLASAATGAVSVVNPSPGGGPSNVVYLPVAYPSPAPVFSFSSITAGPGPSAVAVADFNNDGKLDLAVTNSGANTVSILLGNGDGTFAAGANYATGNLPMALAVRDFNHDGIPDLAIVNQSDGTVSILLGTGGGAFGSQITYATGSQPAAIFCADLNGDGNLDLAVANQADDTVSILLGNGDGTFAPQLAYPAGASPDALVAADFNGDGKPDLAVGNDVVPNGTVTILLNHGDGSYLPGVSYATDDAVSLVAADFNGDGILDFASASYLGATLYIYQGSGKGGFTSAFQTSHLSPNLIGLAAADVNADGSLELLMGGNANIGLTVFENNYDGTFATLLQTGALMETTSLAVGDFNGDGSIDAVLGSSGSNIISVAIQSPAMALSNASLNFGNVATLASATQTVTLTNSGSAILRIGKVATTGAFSETNNCSASIAPGGNCTVSVVFKPTTLGTQTGSLTIASNIPGAAQSVNLTGIGSSFTASIALSQGSVIGGNPLAANAIVLSSAAPAGGWQVSLSSSNPALASVPSSLTVAAGQTISPNFAITTTAVSVNTPATITATVNGFSANVILTVNPIAVSIRLSSTQVTGGKVIGSNTIVLASPAPASGLVFNLSSSNPALVSVPASVTVPANATESAAFSISTGVVGSQTSPTVFASLSGVSGNIAYAELTLFPTLISSVVLTPNSVIGGESTSSNTVNLSAPAPAGGSTVTLSSSNSNLAGVPASVLVPANATSAPFAITTGYVGTTTPVTITGSVAGSSVNAVLTLNPDTVASVNLSSASTVGGSAPVGSNAVTLLAPAPPSGATVTLSSSNPPVAAVPASVKVSAGAVTSGAFKITTTPVSTVTPVTITATYHGVAVPVTLTVDPLEPESLTLNESTVLGGKTITGNFVTLNAAAPSPGVVVSLSSSNPAVAPVPATVEVATGSRNSPKFSIATTAVQAHTTVTITATYQGYVATATLVIKP